MRLYSIGLLVALGALLLCGTVYLFMTSTSELAPQEDQGAVLVQTIGPPNATIEEVEQRFGAVLHRRTVERARR